MATNRAAGAKKSKGRTDTTPTRREIPGTAARAHRDTPEAKRQQAGTPKTHPTRASVASRKSPAGRDQHDVQQTTGTKGTGGRTRKSS